MNNKILSGVLVLGIATTGFAGYSSANSNTGNTLNNNLEIRELFDKAKSGETLSVDEQTTLEEAKANRGEKKGKHGKRMGMSFLSDEEKTSLESMTDDEKKAFFTTKKDEKKVQHDAREAIVSKILNGEAISDTERASLESMQAQHENKGWTKEGGKGAEARALMEKLLNNETLTDDEQVQLEEIKAKKQQREEKKAILEPIMKKKKAGETLTEAEQTQLDTFKSEHKGKGGKHGKKGGRGEKGGDRNSEDI